mgnify:CR=1 FL=1
MKLGKIVGLALMALTLGLAGQSLAAEPIKIVPASDRPERLWRPA